MRTIVMITVMLTLATACRAQGVPDSLQQNFKKIEWLVGEWNLTDAKPGQVTRETWTRAGDLALHGVGVTLRGTDTVFVERMRLAVRNGAIHYFADVPGNNGEVPFRMTSITSSGFVCENATHDFPKRIAYDQKDKNYSLPSQVMGNASTFGLSA